MILTNILVGMLAISSNVFRSCIFDVIVAPRLQVREAFWALQIGSYGDLDVSPKQVLMPLKRESVTLSYWNDLSPAVELIKL